MEGKRRGTLSIITASSSKVAEGLPVQTESGWPVQKHGQIFKELDVRGVA